MGRTPDVATSGWITCSGHDCRNRGHQRRPYRPSERRRCRKLGSFDVGQSFEFRRGEVNGPFGAQGHIYDRYAGGHRGRSQCHRIGRQERELVLVHLKQIEALHPARNVRYQVRHPISLRIYRHKQRMHVEVDHAVEILPDQLSGFERQLPSADQIDVQRVQSNEQRLEPEPVPAGNATGELFGSSLAALVPQRHAVVGIRHFDHRGVGRQMPQCREIVARALGQVASDLDERYDFPAFGERRIESGERVRDTTPLLHWRLRRISAVYLVPDERADDAKPAPRAHQSEPSTRSLNVATAPTTPADIGSEPSTILHASTAVLNARRFTSACNGSINASPACVTPPASTTVSGLKMLMRLDNPVHRKRAVSRTTSLATVSPRRAASYTMCAVSRDRSPSTSASMVGLGSLSSASRARSAMAGPEQYASRQP